MFSRLRLARLLILPAFAFLAACGGSEAPKDSVVPKTVEDRFPIKVGDRMVQMQIAALPAETEKGLMYRKSMGQDEGMLFVFASAQQQAFWMRNTTLPLDIGYFDDFGELKEIYPMFPLDERTVVSRSHGIQFCLEMNQGWYRQNSVKPGAKLDLKAVSDALKARELPNLAARLRK